MLKKLSVAAFTITWACHVHAGILFAPAVTHMERNLNDGTTSAESKMTMIDFRLGYVWDFGLYLGGLYSLQDQDFFSLADSSDSFFGPSLGYYRNGFFISGTYYIYGERDFTNGTGKLANVQGYQLDFAYTLPVSSSVRLGPQLTYHNYKFKELQASGVAASADVRVSDLTPYFALLFVFNE